jgi:hypothetical protein
MPKTRNSVLMLTTNTLRHTFRLHLAILCVLQPGLQMEGLVKF